MLDVKKAPLLTLRQVDNADIGLLLAALAIIYSVLLLSTYLVRRPPWSWFLALSWIFGLPRRCGMNSQFIWLQFEVLIPPVV